MKLRSRSSKGSKVPENEENSDEVDSQNADTSDSDFNDLEEDMMNEDEGDFPDLNVDSIVEPAVFEDEAEEKVPKRRKMGPSGRRGRSKKVKEQAENQEELGGVIVNPEMFVLDVDEEGIQKALENDIIAFLVECAAKKKKKRKTKGEDKPTLMWEIWEEAYERWIDANEAENVYLDNQNEIMTETVEPPSTLIMPLLRYQKEWLAWALRQEESKSRGGILADEMGMGKTVQAIALVLAKQEMRRVMGEPSFFSSAPSASTSLPAVKGTLVICPLVAVIQWVSEIDRFTSKGSNKVLVYHGSNRTKNLDHLSEYDFVITTYSTVEADYRKNVMPPKVKCEWCGKSLNEDKMSIHLRHFCGPEAIRTAKQSKQQRKNLKLKTNISKQKLLPGKDGASGSDGETPKKVHRKDAKKYKVKKVLGNGFTVDNSGGTEQAEPTRKSVLHSMIWERIILDEAHYIKDRHSNTTRAILALKSSYKWALSGTPLQNRVGELYSLVRFLEIVPFSYYFCKDCDCRTLDYSSSTDCQHCPHKSVRHFCWWNRYVSSPIKDFGNNSSGRRAMFLLKNKILKSIVLRRTKKGRAADLALPPRIVTLRRDSLDIKEEDYYTSLYNESQAQFNTYVEAQTLMNNYAHIFDLLTRLRQAVDHPYLVVYSSTRSGKTTVAGNAEQACGLCHEPVEDAVVTSCGHVFCKSCLIDFSASMGQVSCPSCSKPLTVDFTGNKDSEDKLTKTTVEGFKPSSIINRIRLDDFQTSTKIDALREEIRFMVERDGSAKGIVFSQFTSFLDLIKYSLQKSGVCCVQLVGSMSMAARDAAIKKFTDDPDCRIFLMSLKAGGVALNLTVASHVFLMDPWWNPAVERQAQDRIHRIGQYKPIRIVRFVIKDTIEERILKLQEKKELVFEGTVGGSSEALAKLTEADLRFLFLT
ncbi:hypothetical protein M9H77_19924 [Catharanthus roseus]|uniref:Uncharacterized protein n=1 Tax=Catharanthus roseus TaxID=4058 RepID=A0ACC0AM77_CATRO|nr:hypothetical protein M9H77_19924 [Catharanthus roseus]